MTSSHTRSKAAKLAPRLVPLVALLPLAAWCVSWAHASEPTAVVASAQDPKPAPAPKPEPKPEGREGRPEEPRGGPGGEGRRRRREGGEAGAPIGLHQAMEQMKGEMRTLSESVADATKNEATLKALTRMQHLCVDSKLGTPSNMAEIPADKQAAHTLAFRREMLALVQQLVEVELLVLDGKNAEAAKLVQDVGKARDAGHDKFGGHD